MSGLPAIPGSGGGCSGPTCGTPGLSGGGPGPAPGGAPGCDFGSGSLPIPGTGQDGNENDQEGAGRSYGCGCNLIGNQISAGRFEGTYTRKNLIGGVLAVPGIYGYEYGNDVEVGSHDLNVRFTGMGTIRPDEPVLGEHKWYLSHPKYPDWGDEEISALCTSGNCNGAKKCKFQGEVDFSVQHKAESRGWAPMVQQRTWRPGREWRGSYWEGPYSRVRRMNEGFDDQADDLVQDNRFPAPEGVTLKVSGTRASMVYDFEMDCGEPSRIWMVHYHVVNQDRLNDYRVYFRGLQEGLTSDAFENPLLQYMRFGVFFEATCNECKTGAAPRTRRPGGGGCPDPPYGTDEWWEERSRLASAQSEWAVVGAGTDVAATASRAASTIPDLHGKPGQMDAPIVVVRPIA